ncbi:MAG: CDP-archaeol synthase, partial [Promethearchaeota archaeon]
KFAKDGRRLFGPGKSLRGFWLGPLLGAIIALGIHGILFWQWNNIVQAVDGFIANPNVNYYMYLNQREPLLQNLALFILGDSDYSNPFHAFLKLVPRVFLCAYGAAVGDLFGSWAKRRRNLKRGEPFWGVDQVDFLVGCLLFAGWFVFLPITFISGQVLLMLIIITPTITILANNISFFMGRKTVPW